MSGRHAADAMKAKCGSKIRDGKRYFMIVF